MRCEMELDQAEHHVLDSALNDDVRSRADITLKYRDPTYEEQAPGYFAVQFSKLYREREHGFRTDMVQTLIKVELYHEYRSPLRRGSCCYLSSPRDRPATASSMAAT